MRNLAVDDNILMRVEKPARYIGNEINMIKKNPKEVDIRFCMCFPDVYEIGMSHLPSLGFSTIFFSELSLYRFIASQLKCWFFSYSKKLDKFFILCLLLWCYGVIL